jgi:hypothetical protein
MEKIQFPNLIISNIAGNACGLATVVAQSLWLWLTTIK